MIQGTGLGRRFGAHQVLDGLDVRVRPGERVALLGLNGAGKTTLIRCLLGLLPYDGTLMVAGTDVRRDPRTARRRIGYVPQRAPHFDGTLAETVDFFSALRGAAAGAVDQQLRQLGLPLQDHGDRAVRALSGGMLQKALLGLALAADVPLLLLDEPTANLDARARAEFLRSLREIRSDTTILLASHRLADVAAVADRLLVLHGGRIAFDGTLRGLWDLVGATETLWVRVPHTAREAAIGHVRSRFPGLVALQNGTAFGVRVAHHARADVLAALREHGIPVEEFWTESPSLSELLEGALGLPTSSDGTEP